MGWHTIGCGNEKGAGMGMGERGARGAGRGARGAGREARLGSGEWKGIRSMGGNRRTMGCMGTWEARSERDANSGERIAMPAHRSIGASELGLRNTKHRSSDLGG